MPNYYNPYNFYPASYPVMGGANFTPYANNTITASQQSYSQPAAPKAMEWVEGEVGAKAFQMPQGWPANQPIPLWDSTDTVIYLKSWSPMGIPNPMQKLPYTMPETPNAPTLQGNGGLSGDFATKEDIDSLKEEIKNLRESMGGRKNQNGSYNNGGNNNQQVNKGGNNNG